MNTEAGRKGLVLTCVQPTGQLHLGNDFGEIKNGVDNYLGNYECLFGIVDMHAITVPYNPADLRKNTLDCVAQYVACGLDPEKCSIFVQSQIGLHSELAWILSCICPLGQLQRMTQFKDKSKKQENVGAGLLYYPVLMAADILIYNADIVPVGEDQERNNFSKLLEAGFVDTFRYFHIGKIGHYTWWSPMANARMRNIGWRIDYFLTTKNLEKNLNSAKIHAEYHGSDHAPIELEISL
jgi:hypothetical protein